MEENCKYLFQCGFDSCLDCPDYEEVGQDGIYVGGFNKNGEEVEKDGIS